MSENFIKKSKIRGNKAIFSIVLSVLLVLGIFAVLPITNAHSPPWTIPTFAFLTVSPDHVGVGQQVLVVMWLDKTSPDLLNYEWGEFFTGYKVSITKPDGLTETLGPFTADAPSSIFTHYTPAQVGTYKFVFSFPGQTIYGKNLWPGFNLTGYGPLYPVQAGRDPNYINDTFSPSVSAPFYLTVQQAQIQPRAETPVPTGYWTRPINGMNRLWSQVSGNWLAGAAQNVGPTEGFAYGNGPESAHVLWTRPMWAGGIVGGTMYDALPFTNRIDSSNLSPIILDGKLYYNINKQRPYDGWYCVDLYTGQTLYFKNATTTTSYKTSPTIGIQSITTTTVGLLAFGSVEKFFDPDWAGQIPYLWVTTTGITNQWDVLDAFSGNRVFSIANVSSAGTAVYGSDGSIDRYNIVNLGTVAAPKYYLTLWNSTLATARWRQGLWVAANPTSLAGETVDGNYGFSLNVSIPAVQGTIRTVREGQYVIGGTQGYNYPGSSSNINGNLWALSLKPGQEGTLLWNITFTPPANAEDQALYGATGPYNPGIAGWEAVGTGGSFIASSFYVDPEDGVFVMAEPLTQTRWGFSLSTGQQLWKSAPESPWQYYSMYTNIYDGKLFSSGYGGQIIAYNIKTGAVLWNYNATATGFESPYGWGREPLMPPIFADGKLYVYTGEHSPSMPLERSKYIHCLDANTGKELWQIAYYGESYTGGSLSISDGYLVGLNAYDWQIYCIGIGPSAITVSAPENVIPKGTDVLITGTVTDQSAGAKGTPAISDADQQSWMEYLYEQQPFPKDAKGVQVHLTAVDPNGNFQDIGYTTSNNGGTYGITWTPPVEGTYMVTATFEGSKSYGSSYATSYFAVGKASANAQPTSTSTPTSTVAPTPTQTAVSPSPSAVIIPPTSGMPTTTFIAIGSAIVVIVAAAAALILRKRK